jgi:hypothetical protein
MPKSINRKAIPILWYFNRNMFIFGCRFSYLTAVFYPNCPLKIDDHFLSIDNRKMVQFLFLENKVPK